MKTTKKHFELFKSRCYFWRERLNLIGVNLEFSLSELKGAHASSVYDYEGYVAHIELGLKLDIEGTTLEEEIDRLAKHELIHVLTGDVDHCIISRYITEEQGERAIEKLVCDLTAII